MFPELRIHADRGEAGDRIDLHSLINRADFS